MADGLQSLIPSASPIAAMGIDYDELLASGDPAGYMAAKRAGLEYKSPNVTLAPQPAAQSALAAGAGKPQESVAPASQPAPAAGTSISQPGNTILGGPEGTATPTGIRPDLDRFGRIWQRRARCQRRTRRIRRPTRQALRLCRGRLPLLGLPTIPTRQAFSVLGRWPKTSLRS